MKKEVVALWGRSFSSTPPLSFLLRQLYPKRWLRIHSLPEGKRYPESKKEEQELLKRHRQVLQYIFSSNDECIIILSGINVKKDYQICPDLADLDFEKIDRWMSVWSNTLDYTEEIQEMEFYFAQSDYRTIPKIVLENIILSVADDRIANVLFWNLSNNRLYCPYDGGVDLFLENESMKLRVKNTFNSYIPPTGLW